MKESMKVLEAQPLSAQAFAPYGWVLGQPMPEAADADADFVFSNPATDFWREHIFDVGPGGEVEILNLHYRDAGRQLDSLEAHDLTQQALMPLTGEVLQAVACAGADGMPDAGSLAVFRIPVGQGICMRPGCWHATRIVDDPVACIMLTRVSTTLDLIAHLKHGRPATESRFAAVPAFQVRVARS